MMMDGMMAGMGLWGLLMLLAVISVLALAVLGSVWLYRQLRGPQVGGAVRAGDEDDSALRRLRERFAAGEIDEQEFERRLSALTHWR